MARIEGSPPDGWLEQDRSLAGDNRLGSRGEKCSGRGLRGQAYYPGRLSKAHQAALLSLTGQHCQVLRWNDQARLTTWTRAGHHHLALRHNSDLRRCGRRWMALQLKLARGNELPSCQLELLSFGELQLLTRANLETASSSQLQGLMNTPRSSYLDVAGTAVAVDPKVTILLLSLALLLLDEGDLLRCGAAFS